MIHKPVLLDESLEYLITKPDGVYFDGTVGFGGHSAEILKKLTNDGILVATDKDIDAYNHCKEKFADDERMKLFKTSYKDIYNIANIEFIDGFDGIFADLGVSSYQLDNAGSGFTYREEAPLDMRMDKSRGISAIDIVNGFEEEEIADIIYKYGEERKSRQIAKRIVNTRQVNKITTTTQLRNIVEEIIPERFAIRTLSRVFQALRIYVNNEIDDLIEFLENATPLLNPGGRIVILTYHSLEDREVKEHFKYEATECICPPELPICNCDKEKTLKIITRKPVLPAEEEIKSNTRARSAKLRAAERL
ncbi:MAG: 16S rRNA (cytosine(1402)-N(4))-methyltransferase RsmH [Rhodothermaceae bacterium]